MYLFEVTGKSLTKEEARVLEFVRNCTALGLEIGHLTEDERKIVRKLDRMGLLEEKK